MTKTRAKEGPPLELPPARLFLDDLQEVIRVFYEGRHWAFSEDQMPELTLKILVGEWECDSLEDLRSLGQKATGSLFLECSDPTGFAYRGGIYISGRKEFVCSLPSLISDDGKWSLYGQVHSIVEKRRLRWFPWRRSLVFFENSFEHKGIVPTLKRHATSIAVAVVTAVLTLVASHAVEKLIQWFHSK